MFNLCTISAVDLMELQVGPRSAPSDPTKEPEIKDIIMIGQAPDCSSYLILTSQDHEKLTKHTSVPEGYDFIFRQEWGLTINESIIHRVIETLRKESYPPMSDYLDAKVKGDLAQEHKYIEECEAVKLKYPKFAF